MMKLGFGNRGFGTVAKSLAATVLGFAMMSGCGGKTDDAGNQEVLDRLVSCQQERDRAKTAADMCSKQLDEAKAAGPDAGAPPSGEAGWLVRADGSVVTINGSSKDPGTSDGQARISDTQAAKLTAEVTKQIKASKSGIQQCYVQALKKNTSLQAVVIPLKVTVMFDDKGKVEVAKFSPFVSADFNVCMGTITRKWSINGFSGKIPFEATVTLQPQS